jgi:hypothetical protein
MLGCKMLKTSLPDHQTMNMAVNKQLLVCSNMYSLHAHHFVKNIVLNFWNINIYFSYINISQKKLYWEIRMFYEVWILNTKRHSTGKTLTGEMFCGVCLYILIQYKRWNIVTDNFNPFACSTPSGDISKTPTMKICNFRQLQKSGSTKAHQFK